MTTNNGGPAFPRITKVGDITVTSDGMSLRDYFAAKAMQVLIPHALHEMNQFTAFEISSATYGYADAMIAAREESTP